MIGPVEGGRVVVLLEKGLEEVVVVVALDVLDWAENMLEVLVVLDVESLDPCRDLRRKGSEGARKVGKNAGFARGSDDRRT